MSLSPLPVSIIGGYLGAGKTTLINKILSEDHGARILVLVNDFGAINIDASLLISAKDDTIELANGCVCCTMGSDLFMAVADALDRRPRPDHLIIEASGVADPAKIAEVARAEPDLSYAGIVTVVDGLRVRDLLNDPQIGAQIHGQIACADLLIVSKTPLDDAPVSELHEISPVSLIAAEDVRFESILLSNPEFKTLHVGHSHYTSWSHEGAESWRKEDLMALLNARPKALYRVKGHVRGDDGTGMLVQIVGPEVSVTATEQPQRTQLVGIGLADALTADVLSNWSEPYVQATQTLMADTVAD